MKIYYITDIILNNSLVETVHVDEICKNLSKMGHEVILFVPQITTFTSSGNYEIVSVPSLSFAKSLFFQIAAYVMQCARIINEKKPDIIYSRHSPLLFEVVCFGKMFKIPVILEINGKLVEEAIHLNENLLTIFLFKTKIFNLIERINIRLATGFIVVTPSLKEYLINRYKIDARKICVIQNAVDTVMFSPNNALTKRSDLGLVKENLCIGYLGSLHNWQGLKYLVLAAEIIRKKIPEVKVVIIGNGIETSQLKSLIIEKNLEGVVELHDAIPHELAPAYINSFDVCINYPLKFRGGATSPFKVYEYLACAKATIVSDIIGMREEFGGTVEYADPESVEDLSKKLYSLLLNSEKRRDIGEKGRKFVEEGHSWKVVVEKIIIFCKSNI